ncbi:MAG: hypothetical protein ACXWR1_05960 [Bdellovibrionota bacterium]
MNNKREGIPFNGFQSVIEMLRHADVAFRDKLLTNVRRRDPQLARRLESELREWIARDDNRGALERGQRLAQTRNYGN